MPQAVGKRVRERRIVHSFNVNEEKNTWQNEGEMKFTTYFMNEWKAVLSVRLISHSYYACFSCSLSVICCHCVVVKSKQRGNTLYKYQRKRKSILLLGFITVFTFFSLKTLQMFYFKLNLWKKWKIFAEHYNLKM